MKRKTRKQAAVNEDAAEGPRERAAHSPLPWAILSHVKTDDRIRVIDLLGGIVLEADGNEKIDIANLELIVSAVNRTVGAESNDDCQAAGFHESRCKSFTGGPCDCVARIPVSESSETGEGYGA